MGSLSKKPLTLHLQPAFQIIVTSIADGVTRERSPFMLLMLQGTIVGRGGATYSGCMSWQGLSQHATPCGCGMPGSQACWPTSPSGSSVPSWQPLPSHWPLLPSVCSLLSPSCPSSLPCSSSPSSSCCSPASSCWPDACAGRSFLSAQGWPSAASRLGYVMLSRPCQQL